MDYFWKSKGCWRGTRGTDDINQHILNETKTRRKNVAMVWIDYKKANEMILQTWITECQKMYKIFNKIINFIMEAMKN